MLNYQRMWWERLMRFLTFSLPLLLLFVGYCFGSLGHAADDPKTSTPEVKVREPVKLTENALRIHREALLVDGHNDLPWQFRIKKDLSFRTIDISKPQKA